jgi:imidazolonepropionase-like amidohydrolase
MNQAGVPIVAGTDLGVRDIYPGVSLHEELHLLSKAGMSNLDVLRSATLNPARCMGLSADYGAIAKGKVADILVLNENPLMVLGALGRPSHIIHDGVVH